MNSESNDEPPETLCFVGNGRKPDGILGKPIRKKISTCRHLAIEVDTREQTGLCVLWRDPIPPQRVSERLANCRWLLEETLAGRSQWPEAGETTLLGRVGGTA